MSLTKLLKSGLIAGGAALLFVPAGAQAIANCVFTKDLTLGYQGEEVRCLQKYLNENGFKVADTGVGSPGQETSLYREKTVAAVKKWQEANGISPATGTFGPLSRTKYLVVANAGTVSTPTTPTTPIIPTTPTLPTTPIVKSASTVTPNVASQDENNARNALKKAHENIEDAQDAYDDAKDDDDEVGDAKDLIEEAEDKLLVALWSFVNKEFSDARKDAQKAEGLADDAFDEMDVKKGNSSKADEDEADDAIKDAEDALDELDEAIDDAKDDGDDTDDAEDLLNDAEDALDEAYDAFDDEDWDDAVDAAEEAQDLAEEGLDEL